MADNRHFTDALQNEGGSPVYLEDKKLAERTPVSGAASIANLKFLLANDDTEGFNTAIKAYIDEAVRSALGALVNNLDKGTAISRILATDGNNDLGTITPANLSSVLGVDICFQERGTINGVSTLNRDLLKAGVYWSSSWIDQPSNVDPYGHVICISDIRLYSPYDSSKLFSNHHVNGSWKGWEEL